MKKLIFTIFIALVTAVSSHAQLPSYMSARLTVVFDSLCKKYHIKGASAAIVVPRSGTWTSVYGESHAGAPVTKDMLFGIGSNTKTMTAAVMLKLQEQNMLDLDDTIGRWIINKPNISGQITIRQLLNHTSGLFNFTRNIYIMDSVLANSSRIWKLEELYGFIEAPYFAPGMGWTYSNTNYILAGIIIEKVTGKPVHKVLREEILTPHGLKNTFYYPVEMPSQPLAHPWSVMLTANVFTDLYTRNYSNNAIFSMSATAGSVIQNAEDNARFWDLLISGRILGKESMNELLDTVDIEDGVGYGLGIFTYPSNMLNGRAFYSHGGTNIGYINENLIDSTSGICISVLTNQDSIENGPLLGRIIGALHKETIKMRVGVDEAVYNSPSVNVYPNPASSAITVSITGAHQQLAAKMFDMTGKCVLLQESFASGETLSVSGVPAGMYYLEVKNAEGQLIQLKKMQVTH